MLEMSISRNLRMPMILRLGFSSQSGFSRMKVYETTLLIVESYHVNGVTEQWFVIMLLYYELFALQIKRNNILVAT